MDTRLVVVMKWEERLFRTQLGDLEIEVLRGSVFGLTATHNTHSPEHGSA